MRPQNSLAPLLLCSRPPLQGRKYKTDLKPQIPRHTFEEPFPSYSLFLCFSLRSCHNSVLFCQMLSILYYKDHIFVCCSHYHLLQTSSNYKFELFTQLKLKLLMALFTDRNVCDPDWFMVFFFLWLALSGQFFLSGTRTLFCLHTLKTNAVGMWAFLFELILTLNVLCSCE